MNETQELYQEITKALIDKELTISTMESCTSGLIAALLTNIEGSSKVLKGAFVTYCNEAKIKQGVPRETIKEYGVYSTETSAEMAVSCKVAYDADIGIGVTGTASNVDNKNSDSISNKVYFSIKIDKDIYNFYFYTKPEPNRFLWKMAVAKTIGGQLLNIIKSMED